MIYVNLYYKRNHLFFHLIIRSLLPSSKRVLLLAISFLNIILYCYVARLFQSLHDDLDMKTTAIANLSRQLSLLEAERQSLHERIFQADQALKGASSDNQSLNNYIDTLIHAFHKVSACPLMRCYVDTLIHSFRKVSVCVFYGFCHFMFTYFNFHHDVVSHSICRLLFGVGFHVLVAPLSLQIFLSL